jgi:hypothetical protein
MPKIVIKINEIFAFLIQKWYFSCYVFLIINLTSFQYPFNDEKYKTGELENIVNS